MASSNGTRIVKSGCFFCHGGCGIIVHVEDGRAVKIEGDPEHPNTCGQKIHPLSGLLATREVAATAEAAGMRLVIGHGFGLTAYTLAEVHLAATCAAFLPEIESVGPLKMADDVVDQPIDIGSGRILLPQGPGLGVTFDKEKLERYRAKGKAKI